MMKPTPSSRHLTLASTQKHGITLRTLPGHSRVVVAAAVFAVLLLSNTQQMSAHPQQFPEDAAPPHQVASDQQLQPNATINPPNRLRWTAMMKVNNQNEFSGFSPTAEL
jgi:hypothetical protein